MYEQDHFSDSCRLSSLSPSHVCVQSRIVFAETLSRFMYSHIDAKLSCPVWQCMCPKCGGLCVLWRTAGT